MAGEVAIPYSLGMKLVTVASYPQAVEAELARNYLADAGLQAFVADAQLVTMMLPYQIALGGVKVQVKDEDAPAARELLAEYQASPVDEAELERQALAELREDAAPSVLSNVPADRSDEAPVFPAVSARPRLEPKNLGELYAQRAFRGAFLGMFVPLLFVVVWWLAAKSLFSSAPLRTPFLVKALLSVVITMLYLYLIIWVPLTWYYD